MMDHPQNLWQQGVEILARIEAEEQHRPAIAYPVFHSPAPRLTLEELIADLGNVPQGTALLGICDDGLPVLFDLKSGQAGSILVVGDPGSGKSRLLETLISSVCLTNSPRSLRFSVIGAELGDRYRFPGLAQYYRSAAPGDTEAEKIVKEYQQIAEQRRFGREAGPALLLIIADLDRLLEKLDDDAYQALLWLAKNGPASQVWVIASLGTPAWEKFPAHLLSAFHTWLVGHIEPYQPGTNLAQLPVESACCLIPNAQFSLSFNGEWLSFWVPEARR